MAHISAGRGHVFYDAGGEWVEVGYTSETVTFEYEVRGKAMDNEEEAQALRLAAVQVITIVSEHAAEGIATIHVMRKADEVAVWLSGQENKALAVEALNAAAVSVGRTQMTDVPTLIVHARTLLAYIAEGRQ